MSTRFSVWFSAMLFSAVPHLALACACGCGVFDVTTGSMLPTGPGGTVFAEYDFMNQNRNWHNSSSAPAQNNDDRTIRTNFLTLGGQYMFSRSWGVEAEVPYWDRYFNTTGDDGNLQGHRHDAFGDVKLRGIYSGFSPDMSTGVTFGIKLPNGDYQAQGFDRDTQIGTGSTDILLGAYHQGALDIKVLDNDTHHWNWFVNAQLDQPVITTAGYRPGSEVDAVTGVYYEGTSIGNVQVTPLAQVIGSYRLSDMGPAADPDDSGYKRVLLSPAVELNYGNWSLFADVAFPVFQEVKGNQLVAQQLFSLNISRSF